MNNVLFYSCDILIACRISEYNFLMHKNFLVFVLVHKYTDSANLIFCVFFFDQKGDRSSPSSARRRGTDFTQMDASLWFTQAKCDLDSANNDMHPITGKPAYEWVCYKCYRVKKYLFIFIFTFSCYSIIQNLRLWRKHSERIITLKETANCLRQTFTASYWALRPTYVTLHFVSAILLAMKQTRCNIQALLDLVKHQTKFFH